MKTSDINEIKRSAIKNIIFDWGGVITNIDYQSTIAAFSTLGCSTFNEYFTHTHQQDIFKQFEIGKLTLDQVRCELRNLLLKGTSDEQIDSAWCAMLGDTPDRNLVILSALKNKYNLYLLSNTNIIHAGYYMGRLKQEKGIHFPDFFVKTYFSHEINMRKPNKEIFEFVLRDSKMDATETLFIDDTEVNIDVASSLDIQSFYLRPGQNIVELFRSWIQ